MPKKFIATRNKENVIASDWDKL